LKKAQLELRSLEKSGGEGSFGLTCCLDGAAKTEGGAGIGGGATVGARARLVMS